MVRQRSPSPQSPPLKGEEVSLFPPQDRVETAGRGFGSRECVAVSLGVVGYAESMELQRQLHRQVVDGTLPDLLLLLEHPHVYTLGRRGKEKDLLATEEERRAYGVEVHRTDRGGEVTYHGPGQLVGYPIVDLRRWGGGPLAYVRALEAVLSATLGEFGLSSQSGEKPTGVWVSDAKIAAIGVKISRRVTMHGFGLNVDPDLSYFDRIVPCGMPDAQVTSMAALLVGEITVEQVVPVLIERFGETFGLRVSPRSPDEIESVLSLA